MNKNAELCLMNHQYFTAMKKSIKLFDKKISQFPDIISWAKTLDVTEPGKFLTNNKANKLFLASGGSYSAAAFAELLSVKKQIMAHAMTPHFYLTSGFYSLPAQTLLISASGANNDICRTFEAGKANLQEMKAITLSSKGKLQSLMNDSESGNVYSYDIPTGRDGFLSTNTVLSFYILLYRAFGYNDLDELQTEMPETESEEINRFITSLKHISDEEMTEHEAFLHKLEGVDSFFILYTGKSYPAALDIESKFSEGAIGNTQLADYRNFAHGRFNWFTQRPGQTGLICLQTPEDTELSEEILNRLPVHVPILRLRTSHTTPLGCIDLLIKEHYLCSALADRWGLDISRPSVPEYGKFLHGM